MPQVIRKPALIRWGCSSLFLAIAVVLVVGAVHSGGLAIAWSAPLALGAVAVAVRSWQLRVVHSDSVLVVNWLRNVRIPWREVEGFGCDENGTAWVRTRAGRTVTIAALSVSTRSGARGRRVARRGVRELESVRQKRRRHGGGRDRAVALDR